MTMHAKASTDVILKVGDPLWFHDTDRTGDPWRWASITDATRLSWLIAVRGGVCKVSKHGLLENLGQYGKRQWYTPTAKAVKIWIEHHRRNITSQVSVCDDVEVLMQIADLVGYKPAGWENDKRENAHAP